MRLPVINKMARRLKKILVPNSSYIFRTSEQYWDDRYKRGGNSGAGLYGPLARFKADVLNHFVRDRNIQSIIELGCGDGSQLAIAEYPRYIGTDVSREAIKICKSKFRKDPTKIFYHTSDDLSLKASAEMALSLDVLYHLVEDDVFNSYMERLVASAQKYVCIYSSNFDEDTAASHVRNRCFTAWMRQHAPSWLLISKIDNLYHPNSGGRADQTSWSDFYFFERK